MTPTAPAFDSDIQSLRNTAARLPLTMRPSVVQQINEFDMLFPFEQKRLLRFLRGVDSLNAADLDRLTAPLCGVEKKMGVAQWSFSETSNTMENSAQLARSEHYAEWRQAVARLYDAIEERAQSILPAQPTRHSLVVAILPDSLPVTRNMAWKSWKTEGTEIAVTDDASLIAGSLLRRESAIGKAVAQPGTPEAPNFWIVDAETRTERGVNPRDMASASCLSWSLLDSFRAHVLAGLNTIPRDTHVASQTLTILEQKDWSRCWPAELAGQDRLRKFVLDLYLSGNGALIFPNAFVQWAAAEVFRRARPPVLIARFGVRNKPKPFTSIAIFENQSTVSTAPDVPDPENSAVDAAILARYIWLSTLRYREYEQMLFLCVAEHANSVRWIGPPGSGLETMQGPHSSTELHDAVLSWLSAT